MNNKYYNYSEFEIWKFRQFNARAVLMNGQLFIYYYNHKLLQTTFRWLSKQSTLCDNTHYL